MISFSLISVQSRGITGTAYFCSRVFASDLVLSEYGSVLFKRIMKGLLISFNSSITFSSAISYSFRSISLIVPSVVITIPIVE